MSYSENSWNIPCLFFAFLYIKILWNLFVQTLKHIQHLIRLHNLTSLVISQFYLQRAMLIYPSGTSKHIFGCCCCCIVELFVLSKKVASVCNFHLAPVSPFDDSLYCFPFFFQSLRLQDPDVKLRNVFFPQQCYLILLLAPLLVAALKPPVCNFLSLKCRQCFFIYMLKPFQLP